MDFSIRDIPSNIEHYIHVNKIKIFGIEKKEDSREDFYQITIQYSFNQIGQGEYGKKTVERVYDTDKKTTEWFLKQMKQSSFIILTNQTIKFI